jgi:PAS domain S-box-containing protein
VEFSANVRLRRTARRNISEFAAVGGSMLAADIDFYKLFRINATVMALLTADFIILDVNDAALETVGRSLEELVGHNWFEVIPRMRENSGGDPEWTALEEALTSGKRVVRPLKRQDLEDPENPGVFEERYWSTMVTPIRGKSGQIELLEFSAREVTSIIAEFRRMQATKL